MGSALEKRLAQLDRTRRAAEALSADMQQVAALAGIELAEALAVKPDAVVFRALWRGRAVVVKRFLAADAGDTVTRMQAELAYAADHLTDARFAINRCLLALPDAGIILLSDVPGRRLRDCLAEATPPERIRLLRMAADWLAAYTAPRLETAGFGAKHWVRRAEATDISHLSAADRSLAAALIESIVEHALAARGTRLSRSPGHGDFVDLNLVYDGTTLYGVDIQGPARLPVARMVARFLTWQQLHADAPEGPREFGLNTADLDAFLGGGLLPAQERDQLLAVFVGDQLLFRFCESIDTPKHHARAAAAIESYIGAP